MLLVIVAVVIGLLMLKGTASFAAWNARRAEDRTCEVSLHNGCQMVLPQVRLLAIPAPHGGYAIVDSSVLEFASNAQHRLVLDVPRASELRVEIDDGVVTHRFESVSPLAPGGGESLLLLITPGPRVNGRTADEVLSE